MDQQKKIGNIQREIDETKHLLRDNTEKLIERDNHLDDIGHKSANLALNSQTFQTRARNLKTKMCIKSYMIQIIGAIIILCIVLYIIISSSKKK